MVWILALIGAITVATLLDSAAGLAIGAALGYLLGRINTLEAELQTLRRELRNPRTPGTVSPVAQDTPDTATAATTPAPSVPGTTAIPTRPPPLPPPLPRTAVAAQQPPTSWMPPSSAPAGLPPLLARALTWLRGGNPLARAGIVILFFGGAFLAKYAAEHSHFPIQWRMAALAAGALGLLALGWRLRRTREAYAQTLQGGGIAGLYLTIFAAARLYDLLTPAHALVLLVLVASVAATLAVVQDALALALFGTAGGFLAPILLSTGSGNEVALFSYYTALNLGVFAVAWFRAWRVLNLVGLIFTFGIAGLFRVMSYSPEKLLVADGFLLLYFLMYVAITLLFALRQKPELKNYVSSSLVFGLPLAAFAIHGSMIERYEYGLAWSALAFSVFYLVLAWLLHRTRREQFSLLSEAFAALGIIFGSLAIPMAFDHQTTAASWAVEGAGLLWIGVRQQRGLARAFGLLLQLLGGAAVLLAADGGMTVPSILNRMTLSTTLLAISGVLSALWLYRNRDSARAWERNWEPVAALWGIAWWFHGGFREIAHALAPFERGADLILLAASAALLGLLGTRQDWPLARRLPAALLPFAAVIGILSWPQHPLIQAAALGWLLVFSVHYALLRLGERDGDALIRELRPWLHAGAFWLLALLAAWELDWQIGRQALGVWSALPWGLAPALLLFLCSRAADWPGWPLRPHAMIYRQQVAPLLALWTALWLLVMNLCSDGNPGHRLYTPLLNPLDIASMLALLGIRLWWRQLEPEASVRRWLQPSLLPQAIFAALVFVWLNAALIRGLHYTAGTPLTLHGITHSTLVQAALSIFWGLLGFTAMIGSARRRQRHVWIAGATLMTVVVLKLFLVDTSGSGTLARIAAFLSVGALLLLTGYLSPLPPRIDNEGTQAP
ncbi:MAG: DUF2339 domain-containing protein [Stenotrophobium sp.]